MKRLVSIAEIVLELERHDLLPAIIFRGSRHQCDSDAERAMGRRSLHLAPPRQRILQKTVRDIVARYDMDWELIKSHPQYSSLISTGIGAHHAGQLLIWRLLLEELMVASVLRVLVATGTVAAGVDFPARSVVITAHSQRGQFGVQLISSAEFQQMSGRAGRRGRDTVGFCLVAPSFFCDGRKILKIASRPAEALVSRYFPSASTVLNLLRYRTVDGLRYTVDRSFAAFTDAKEAKELLQDAHAQCDALPEPACDLMAAEISSGEASPPEVITALFQSLSKEDKALAKRIRRNRKKADQLKNRQAIVLKKTLAGLSTLGYLEGNSLSEKGTWAANLCTTLVLQLAELLESSLLDDVDLESLVILVSSISGDAHRPYLKSPKSFLKKDDISIIGGILQRVAAEEIPGVSSELSVLPDAAYTVSVWLQAESWQVFRGVLQLAGVQEGDAARLITQTAEHLGQIARLERSHYELSLMAKEGKRNVLRPPLTDVFAAGVE